MRITKKILEKRIEYLNDITNSPKTPYKRINEKLVAQVGNFHLSGAYGGWRLERITNESGGCTNVFNCGYESKSKLKGLIDAYINALMDIRYEHITVKKIGG